MSRSFSADTRLTGQRLFGIAAALALGLWATAVAVRAQVALDQRVDTRVDTRVDQGGRLFDANPLLGGGGYNYARPVSPLVGGNLYAAGLVGRGFSLRIRDPIPSVTSFRAPLGTRSLYAFRRDSVSLADAAQPLGSAPLAQAFYDPATTVGTVGFWRGLSGLPSGGIEPLDLRLDARLDIQRGLGAQIVGLKPPTVPGTSSGIFGLEPPPRLLLPTEAQRIFPWSEWTREPRDRGSQQRGQPEAGDSRTEDLSGELSALATPLDFVLREELDYSARLYEPGERIQPWAWASRDSRRRPGLIVPEVEDQPEPQAVLPYTPRIVDPSLLPGYDVFNDLRLALALSADPEAPWFQDLQQALREQPDLASELPEEAAQDAEEYVLNFLNTPLRTFTGGGASTLNNELLKAESLMEIGHYYEAAEHYEMAHLLDPANPLPLIGRGHALLAAGDYRSAAFALLRGLERFPELAHFSIDLQALMGGGEVIDIRRADIMDRLEQRETAELRFLLGYLEYHTGDRDRGLANLDRAANNPRASALIARYPALLRGQVAPSRPPRMDHRPVQPGPGSEANSPEGASGPARDEPAETLVLPPIPEPVTEPKEETERKTLRD